MEPIVGFHLVGVINFAALCFINSYIYDPQGRLRLYARYGAGAAVLAADIKLLLAGK